VRPSLEAAIRHPYVRAAVAMSLVDTIAFATVDLLVPLDLGHRGASTLVIALAITSGAVLGALVGPPGGRLVDRIGAGPVGLATGAAIAVVPLVLSTGLSRHGLLAVLVIGGPIFTIAASSMYPLGAIGADEAGVAHVAVHGLLGASWAIGFAVAPVLASLIVAGSSQAVAFLAATALCLPLLVVIARNVRRPTPG
jgi:MFS family permease